VKIGSGTVAPLPVQVSARLFLQGWAVYGAAFGLAARTGPANGQMADTTCLPVSGGMGQVFV